MATEVKLNAHTFNSFSAIVTLLGERTRSGRAGQLSSRRQLSSVRSMRGTCGATAAAAILAASSAMHAQAASRTVWLLVRAQRT